MKRPILTFLVLLSCMPAAVSAYAETKSVPVSSQQISLSYADVVKRVAPAVVNIYTKKIVRQRMMSPFLDDPFFQQFFGGGGGQGLTRERMQSALGSGVLIGADGLIVTSNHVIAGADQITVVLSDKREFEATLLSADDRSDLAVLRITVTSDPPPYLELKDSDEVEVGDLVLAIGDPFGVGQTVTSGIVSALARTNLDSNGMNYFIQTDAAINPGNSGGALVTMDGKLIGINAAIFSRSGGYMGIGFAVPSNMVRAVTNAVAAGKKNVVRPWTGIDGQEITTEVAASLGLKRPTGMLVNGLHPASPAKAAGMKIGDVITAVNGKVIDEPGVFKYRIATQPVGTKIDIDVQRGQQKLTLPVTLIAPPENPARDETLIEGNNPLAGATLANLSPAVSEEMGWRSEDTGVIVMKVSEAGAAANVGFQIGDILVAVNGAKVASVRDAQDILKQRPRGWRLAIKRDGSVINIMVGG